MAYATAGDIIRGALGKILVIGSQETLTDADMQTGLDALNALLDSWWTQSLAVYTLQQENFPVTGNVGSYTVGPSGTWNTVRPVRIVNAFARYQNVDYPVKPIDRVQFDAIPYKNVSGMPMVLFWDREYPIGTLTLYPVPYVSMQLYFDSYQQIQSFAAYTDPINLPPGYARALIYNLAMDLCDDFGKAPTQTLSKIAADSLGNIKRLNRQDQILRFDYALLYNTLAYNVYSDTYR
jgi:hypothetical protein